MASSAEISAFLQLQLVGSMTYSLDTGLPAAYNGSTELELGTEDINIFTGTTRGKIDKWCQAAKDLGMRGLNLTYMHVGGFVLGDSVVTPHRLSYTNWRNGPNGFDVFGYFVQACRNNGLKVGGYFSVMDRFEEPPRTTPSPQYIARVIANLTDMLTKYGAFDFIIIDCSPFWVGTDVVPASTFLDLIRRLQPSCVILSNNQETTTANTDITLYEVPLVNVAPDGRSIPTANWITITNISQWFDHPDRAAIGDTEMKFAIGNIWSGAHQGYLSILNFQQALDGTIPTDIQTIINRINQPQGVPTAKDDFSLTGSEVAGVALQNHTAADGSTYVKNFGTLDAVISPAGRVRPTDVALGDRYYMNVAPPSANYRVELDFILATNPAANFEARASIRHKTDGTESYDVRFTKNGSNFGFQLYKNSGGFNSLDGVADLGIPASTTAQYRITVSGVGTDIRARLYINGLLTYQLHAVDATVSAANRPGFYLVSTTTSDSTGLQMTGFRMIDESKSTSSASFPKTVQIQNGLAVGV